jgi:hypothetical protein
VRAEDGSEGDSEQPRALKSKTFSDENVSWLKPKRKGEHCFAWE